MKAFTSCLLAWLLSRVQAFEINEVDDDVNATVAPTPALPPTDFPTPEGPFEYAAYGETSFGDKYQDLYYWGYQHAIRRPGWSWDEPLAGYAPFCYGNQTADDACFSVASTCGSLGGTLLHQYYCSFPEDVKIAGPSCWDGNCVGSPEGRSVCSSMGGITVGDDKVQWCLLKGGYTVFGPACYAGDCFESELAELCNSVDGKVWNKHFCLIPDYYTVIGPVCWGPACFSSTKNDCDAIGGTAMKWWCLKKGCDYTVVGPTCSLVQEDVQEQCYEADTIAMCNAVGGDLFAQRFCVIPGTDWTMIGPNAWYDTERINDSRRFCRELQDNIVGPYCQGNTCYQDNVTALCDQNTGELAGPLMCALPPDTYRRAEGPLMWNGEILESSAAECTGFFCAIPEPNPKENLRCPTSAPLGGGGGPGTGPGSNPSPGPGGSANASPRLVALLVGLVAVVWTLW